MFRQTCCRWHLPGFTPSYPILMPNLCSEMPPFFLAVLPWTYVCTSGALLACHSHSILPLTRPSHSREKAQFGCWRIARSPVNPRPLGVSSTLSWQGLPLVRRDFQIRIFGCRVGVSTVRDGSLSSSALPAVQREGKRGPAQLIVRRLMVFFVILA